MALDPPSALIKAQEMIPLQQSQCFHQLLLVLAGWAYPVMLQCPQFHRITSPKLLSPLMGLEPVE